MKNYINGNKDAWEEAFENSSEDYKNRTIELLKTKPRKLFTPQMHNLLETLQESNQKLVQFCCNNGRETLASMDYGYSQVVGFDIAGNMVKYANTMAKDLHLNAKFYETNILEIDDSFNEIFDIAFMTVGAITWFDDLKELFSSVNKTLKEGSHFILEDVHPTANMFASRGDENYQNNFPHLVVNDYFKHTPWIESNGMGYMTKKKYQSKTFTSYSHTMMDIINGLIENGFEIISLLENNIDLSNLFETIDQSIVPLTMVIHAKKVR